MSALAGFQNTTTMPMAGLRYEKVGGGFPLITYESILHWASGKF
jgi:hypothetical protein